MRRTLSKRSIAKLGQVCRLKVTEELEHGYYLEAWPLGQAFLPKRGLKEAVKTEQMLDVFLSKDPQGRLLASIELPKYKVGDVAYLRVKSLGHSGAFMDWGMSKDLLCPFIEQRVPMEEDRSYVVVIYQDEEERLAASSKLSMHLPEKVDSSAFKIGQAVELMVSSRSDLGYSAVIDGKVLGLIHHTLVLKPLRVGQKMTGYIHRIREDGKIDLGLRKPGQAARVDLAEQILQHLHENKGVSSLTDYSTPEEIFEQYRVSKALYKKTLSQLYKARKIEISKEQVRLAKK